MDYTTKDEGRAPQQSSLSKDTDIRHKTQNVDLQLADTYLAIFLHYAFEMRPKD